MLVIRRCKGQSVIISDDLIVTVVNIKARRVAIALKLPRPGDEPSEPVWMERFEELALGEAGSCMVVKVRDDYVHLGFDVPIVLGVHRAECYDAIMNETKLMSRTVWEALAIGQPTRITNEPK